MMQYRALTSEELSFAYKKVFKEAFPPKELKPLGAMKNLINKGIYDVMGLFEDGTALGYICLWKDEPLSSHFCLIDYLCVPKRLRGNGAGSKILTATIGHYPSDTVFIIETEAPKGDKQEDELINRRLQFYERNRAYIADYETALFGVHYKTAVMTGHEISDDVVMMRHDGYYRRHLGDLIYKKFVQIPLKPGERLHPFLPWHEPGRKST